MAVNDLSQVSKFLNSPYCDGWGGLVCYCGGDNCVCGMDGEECPGCDECRNDDCDDADDIYDYEVMEAWQET